MPTMNVAATPTRIGRFRLRKETSCHIRSFALRMKAYSEQDELTRYVWNHYSRFCTETETLANRAIQTESKAQHSSPTMAKMLKEKWGHHDNPGVLAALADGTDAFRKRTRLRIMQDHANQVFINRCPKCNFVVETPTACLCKWCGHTWFERRAELQHLVKKRLQWKEANTVSHGTGCGRS